jgi:putative transposase
LIQGAQQLAKKVGISTACSALDLPRSAFYRKKTVTQSEQQNEQKRKKSYRALSEQEKEEVLQVLYSERFYDKSPREVWATLLDEGVYLCSLRTMYRILQEKNHTQERRRGHKPREYKKPELLATGPNQVWSWDITKLKGPAAWTYFYLYVIIDIYSRCVVGWMIAGVESSVLASELIQQTCDRQNIQKDQLTIHSDRGPSMKSKTVAQLLVELGVLKSHSRPYVPNDNPFSEAQFKTMKYHPSFKERFGCIQDARVFCRGFFQWYNKEHYHTGIGLLTPHSLHTGQASDVIEKRKQVLESAYQKNPHRFVRGKPKVAPIPEAVWINPPKKKSEKEEEQKGYDLAA